MKRIACFMAALVLLQLPVPSVAQGRLSEVLPSFSGRVLGVGDKVLTLERPDSNTIEFHCSGKTRYYDGAKKVKASAIAPGDEVSVEAKRAPDGSLDAVNVLLVHRKPA